MTAARFDEIDEALPLFERAPSTRDRSLQKDHPDSTESLLELAFAYNAEGRFSEAEAVCRRCLDCRERDLGAAHPRTARAAEMLGLCLSNLGDYSGAESVLRRHLDATTAAYGDLNAEAGDLTLSLAEALAMLGRHVESTVLYRRAAEITEEVHGHDHIRFAAALSGLAHTKRRIGNQLEAESLYRRAIDIVERTHGGSHPDLIHYRCRLGMCLHELHRSEEGLESVEEGVALAIQIYGEGSYQAALERRHLGLLLRRQKRASESRSVLLNSLASLEKYYGLDHPYLSKCLKGLAEADCDLGLYDEALIYIRRAISLYERTPGCDQRELTHLLLREALIEQYTEDWDQAVETAFKAVNTALAELERTYQISSTREAVLSGLLSTSAARQLVGAAVAHPSLPDSVLAKAFSMMVITHGQVLDWLTGRQRLLDRLAAAPEVARLKAVCAEASQRVADLVVRRRSGGLNEYLEELSEARREEEEAERALSAASERLRLRLEPEVDERDVSPGALAESLDPGATLVHFTGFSKWLYPQSSDERSRRPHYGAFRLKAGVGSYRLDFVDLGASESLDSLVFNYRHVIEDIDAGIRPSAREEACYRSVARDLYEKVWAPLFRPVGETYTDVETTESAPLVLIVPDRWLNLVDFNTLLAPTGDLLIERWKVHSLTSGKDLLLRPVQKIGSGIVAVGNPIFEGGDLPEVRSLIGSEEDPSFVLCNDAYRIPDPLPGAEEETRAVTELFSETMGEAVELLLGRQATESAMKRSVSGKRVIHIATHGFFCEEETREVLAYYNRVANSLFMSGLRLAPSKGEDDGLLTAYEVTTFDLVGVDWVVLSACGSGLGRYIADEGLFGLRRAFKIAGARTVLTALWRINDAMTPRLMEDVYRNRLNGDSTVDALRKAQLYRLVESRLRFNRIHPSLWGGIIAEGDWR